MRLSNELIGKIIDLKNKGLKSREIASILKVSKSSVNTLYNKYNPKVSTLMNKDTPKFPKVLFIDVETGADISASFGRFKVNLGQDNIIHEGGWLLSVAWRWGHEKETQGIAASKQQALERDDSYLCAIIFDLLEQADIVVTQNGDAFDLPLIKARMAINGFSAPKKVKTVDTLKIARQMRFNSNKLDSLGEVLGVGRKMQHEGIKLWIACQQGDKEALDKMLAYNIQDVELLYKVYQQIKHFDNKAPNMALFHDDEKERCPVCGSAHVEPTGNSVYTQVSEFAEMHCTSCGARSRKRKALNSKDKRKSLLAN